MGVGGSGWVGGKVRDVVGDEESKEFDVGGCTEGVVGLGVYGSRGVVQRHVMKRIMSEGS